MTKRIIFTGGSGKAGRMVMKQLIESGYQVLNLDLFPSDNPDVRTIKCDVADAGQVFSALSTGFVLSEPLEASVPSPPDAVIHFAGIPRPMICPDAEIFRTNVLGVHNVIEAACKMGVKTIILASSMTAYGITYAQGPRDYPSFPIDETLDCNPTDPYALSKIVGETVARSFAERFKVDIYCLRMGLVVEPHEYNGIFEKYIYKAPNWAVHGWSYVDARDLGEICRCGLETNGLAWQVFNATNDEITNLQETTSFLKAHYPDIPLTRPMGEKERQSLTRRSEIFLTLSSSTHGEITSPHGGTGI